MITTTIECRTSRSADAGVRHPIAIRNDWSVVTPHDMEAERVARAFGGYTSCLDLLDRVLPTLHESLWLVARRSHPPLRRDKRKGWRVPVIELSRCCRNVAFRSIPAAVAHLCSPAHLSTRFTLPLWQVRDLVDHVHRACRPDLSTRSSHARFVRESDGLEQLWESGIHPEHVPRVAAFASAVDEPLPVSYFEGVTYSSHDPDWLNEVLTYRPDADMAAWLSWQAPPHNLGDTRDLGRWLEFGLSRHDFMVAVDHALPADIVTRTAEATGWSPRVAAGVVIEYAKSECYPTPAQFGVIARLGLEYAVPGSATVDAAVAEAQSVDTTIDRTEMSLMLAVVGNRPMTLSAIQRGARTVSDLDRFGGQ